jgi:hypothetical protein
MLSPLQKTCSTIIAACIEPDPAIKVLLDALNTAFRESKDQDERLTILHEKLTRMRRKNPDALRGALQYLEAMLNVPMNIDAAVPKSLIQAAGSTPSASPESSASDRAES